MNKASLRALLMVTALLVGLVATASPALADLDAGVGSVKVPIKGGDKDGDADSDSGTSYDEDTDTNDGTANNVEDDGDNAHPSGKDRSVENGGSGTQGKSESNPDDSKGPQRYEGAKGDDKANGPGGTDLADQDGNNGCGNDDDFDDDNNGWCGKPKAAAPTAPEVSPAVEVKVCPLGTDKAGSPMATIEDCNDEEEVLGRTDNAGPKDEDDDDVLGVVLQKATPKVAAAPAAVKADVRGAVLPFTGGAILGYVFSALGLVGAGIIALKATKN